MNKQMLFIVALLVGIFVSCQSDSGAAKVEKKAEKATAVKTLVAGTMEKNGIKLIPVTDSPKFKDSKLNLVSPKNESKQKGEVSFEFLVDNFELGSQTSDAEQKLCANSAKGQHIHLIVNNQPYSAHYTNEFQKTMAENHYVGLAFISRSYHESLKHQDAYELFQFTVGKPEISPTIDLTAPHLFYSRPKGNYIGEQNIERVMLDFYLCNANISVGGYRVKTTINGTEFLISKWQPYFMEGLPEGENKITLELVDQQGNFVEGPFNKVERTFGLYKDEPLKK